MIIIIYYVAIQYEGQKHEPQFSPGNLFKEAQVLRHRKLSNEFCVQNGKQSLCLDKQHGTL